MDRGKSENLIVDEVRQYGHGNCSTNKQIKGKEKTTQTLSTQRTRKSVLVGVGGGGETEALRCRMGNPRKTRMAAKREKHGFNAIDTP